MEVLELLVVDQQVGIREFGEQHLHPFEADLPDFSDVFASQFHQGYGRPELIDGNSFGVFYIVLDAVYVDPEGVAILLIVYKWSFCLVLRSRGDGLLMDLGGC